MSQQCALAGKKTKSILSYIKSSIGSKTVETLIALSSPLVRPHLEWGIRESFRLEKKLPRSSSLTISLIVRVPSLKNVP